MIIHSMKLRNFRGVDEREVAFEPVGVTILEGPNEVGKSSHIDALNLLLEFKSSSKHRDVLATKPVHRDAGPEAEIEASADSYRFRYRKRWIKHPLTELEIFEPTPESLTGDEAHERIQTILAETTDLDLWRALRIMQGDSLNAVDLSDTEALSKALDISAGTTPVGDEETALFQAVVEEYEQYWTATGRESKALKGVEAKVPEIETSLHQAQDDLQAIEVDVERLDSVTSQLHADEKKAPQLAQQLQTAQAAWEKSASAARAEEKAKTELELAQERYDNAANASKTLAGLQQKATQAQQALNDHLEQAALTPDIEQTRSKLAILQADYDHAKQARQAAEDVERLRQSDADDSSNADNLQQMLARKAAIDQARADAEQASKLVATSQASDDELEKLRHALDELRSAQARLDAAAPQLQIERIGNSNVHVDGGKTLKQGQSLERRIETSTVIEVAEHARITVTPGGDLHDLRKTATKHHETAQRLLQNIGAKDWPAAMEANRKLNKAQSQLDELTRIEQDKLRDSIYDALVEQIRAHDARVKAYAKRRHSDLPPPADLAAAQQLLASAKAEAQTARQAEQQAEQVLDEARRGCQQQEQAHTQLNTRTEVLQAQADAAANNLQEASAEHAGMLDKLQDYEADMQRKQHAWEHARQALADINPEASKARLDNAREVVNDHHERLQQLQHERIQIQSRLQVHEEDGLFERWQKLQTRLQAASSRANAMRRRAEAARIVYETLAAARDAARQAYVRPLREAIERLGKIMHGETFRVTLDEDLTVTHRTLAGRTLQFSQLSAGAREQLGILTRVACAMLVAGHGKIPLILDDTLGNTDPDRLAAMGAVLKHAGRDVQMIILTCVPDRFRQVGGAKVVRLMQGVEQRENVTG